MSNLNVSKSLKPEIKHAAIQYVNKIFVQAGDSDLSRVLKKEAFKRIYKQMIREPDEFLPKAYPAMIDPWHGAKPDGPKDFLKGKVVLPSMPQTQLLLRKFMSEADGRAEDLADIIRKDPKLLASVLRLANSGLYKLSSTVDTPLKAVELLGVDKAAGLALGTVSLSLFKRSAVAVLDIDKFWKHSIACGVIAQEIARKAGLGDPDRFFAGGLLHDIGLYVVFESDHGLALQLLELSKSKGNSLYNAERKLLGFDHATLGGVILEEWNLPQSLISAASGHHSPRRGGDDTDAMVIHVADFIARALGYDLGLSTVLGFIDRRAWGKIGISDGELIEMMPDFQRLIEDVFEIFNSS